jgi:tetratricopeptide (TPR) repeat protein
LEDGSFYSPALDAGFHFASSSPFDGTVLEGGALRIARFSELRHLAPRQVDAWSVTLVPYSGLSAGGDGRLQLTPDAGAYLDREKLRIQSVTQRLGHKIVLLTETGQSLEAPADLYPEHTFEIPLTDLPSPPVAIALLDSRREEILRIGPASGGDADGSLTRGRASATPSGSDSGRPLDPGSATRGYAGAIPPGSMAPVGQTSFDGQNLTPQTSEIALRRATFDVAGRHLAYTALGIQALAAKKFLEADAAFEQALLYNADDPLLWWEKALAQRLLGNEEELPELLNAHFLAPLEPALRAEAFLAQPLATGKEPSPLLAAFNENPEDFVEVACLLIERGQFDQAHRWLDEAMRHRDLPMLRLLTAYCLLKGTQMVADAAEHVRAAAQSPGPPYPWRPVEREALAALHARFPSDAHVANLIAFCEAQI